MGSNIKRMVIVHMKLRQYEEAYNKALKVLDIEERHLDEMDIDISQTQRMLSILDKCTENVTVWSSMMNEVRNTLGCSLCDQNMEQDFSDEFDISAPKTKSHVTGHQVRYV